MSGAAAENCGEIACATAGRDAWLAARTDFTQEKNSVAQARSGAGRSPRATRAVMPALVAGIPIRDARCLPKRDGRDIGERSDAVLRTAMPGHDGIRDYRPP